MSTRQTQRKQFFAEEHRVRIIAVDGTELAAKSLDFFFHLVTVCNHFVAGDHF